MVNYILFRSLSHVFKDSAQCDMVKSLAIDVTNMFS
jgi:hypothetical protein